MSEFLVFCLNLIRDDGHTCGGYAYLEKQNVFVSVLWIFNYCKYVEYKSKYDL